MHIFYWKGEQKAMHDMTLWMEIEMLNNDHNKDYNTTTTTAAPP